MADSPENKPAKMDLRFVVIVGISIGVGLAISRGVTQAFETDLGHWGALVLSIVAAGIGGGLTGLLAQWQLRRRGNSGG